MSEPVCLKNGQKGYLENEKEKMKVKTMIGCLCIHGFTGGPYEVEPLAEHLKQSTDWKVKVISLPGHGDTLNLKESNYREWIEAAEEAMKELTSKCEKVYLVGFSMGGMIASYLAANYPESSKLVLLSASGKYLSYIQLLKEWGYLAKTGIKGEWKENFLFQQYKRKMGSVPVKALIEFKKCVDFTRPFLSKVTCPVLIAQGKQDGMVPFKTAHYLEKQIPAESEVVFFENSRHLICLDEDKEDVIHSVFSFLTRSREQAENTAT